MEIETLKLVVASANASGMTGLYYVPETVGIWKCGAYKSQNNSFYFVVATKSANNVIISP